jgi:hypothetical protein
MSGDKTVTVDRLGTRQTSFQPQQSPHAEKNRMAGAMATRSKSVHIVQISTQNPEPESSAYIEDREI